MGGMIADVLTRTALDAARGAPSAHNSQPWRFRPTAAGIGLAWDPARRLPHGDPTGRYLHVGLGAAAEAMVLGAAGHGQAWRVEFGAGPDRHVATVAAATGRPDPADVALAEHLARRKTTRLPFERTGVPVAALRHLEGEAARRGAHLAFVTGRDVKRAARLVGAGAAANFADGAVFAEFTEWVGKAATGRADGLSLESLELTGLTGTVAGWLFAPGVMRPIARLGLHRLAAATQTRLAARCPVFGVLIVPGSGDEAAFEGGRTVLRVWLAATSLGLRVHPMTAALDHPPSAAALAALAGADPGGLAVLCFRLGYGPAGASTPRLALNQLIDGEAP